MVVTLVVVASGLLAAAGGPGIGKPARAATPAAPVPSSRDGSEAGLLKERVSEVMALQWPPASHHWPDPSYSVALPTTAPAASASPLAPATSPPAAPPVPAPLPLPAAPAPPALAAASVPAVPGSPEGVETGLATYYGIDDGYGPADTMADGSPFNPNDPTIAAANAWPLGTRLRVCYQERCIEVCVRDRGAFTHAIDLSYAAFAQLADPSAGVINVTISRVG